LDEKSMLVKIVLFLPKMLKVVLLVILCLSFCSASVWKIELDRQLKARYGDWIEYEKPITDDEVFARSGINLEFLESCVFSISEDLLVDVRLNLAEFVLSYWGKGMYYGDGSLDTWRVNMPDHLFLLDYIEKNLPALETYKILVIGMKTPGKEKSYPTNFVINWNGEQRAWLDFEQIVDKMIVAFQEIFEERYGQRSM
jgi:hypothetical protein